MINKPYSLPAKSPISAKFLNSPYFRSNYVLLASFTFLLPPILTMMHLCIMLYTYWTPLLITRRPTAYRPPLGGPKIALDGMGSARVVLKSWLRACYVVIDQKLIANCLTQSSVGLLVSFLKIIYTSGIDYILRPTATSVLGHL